MALYISRRDSLKKWMERLLVEVKLTVEPDGENTEQKVSEDSDSDWACD